MKRLFALLLVAVLAISLFAACGKDPVETTPKDTTPGTTAGGDTTTPDTTPTQPEEFKNTDKYPLEGEHKLTMGIALDNAEESYLFKLMSDAVGVDIDYQYVTDEQAPLLFVDQSSMPDMLFSAAGTFGFKIQKINEYGEAGALVNYMDYLDKMPNLAKAYADHPDLFDGVMSAEGAVYTLPYYVYTLTGCSNIVYFRADHLKTVGWDKQPTTVDELTELLRDLEEYYGATDPEYVPLTAYDGGHMGFDNRMTQWLFPAFGEDYDPGIHVGADGTIVAGFATEQFKRMVTYMRDLMAEGLMDPDIFTAKSSLMQAFMNENHTSVNTRLLSTPASSYEDGVVNFYISQPLTSEYNDTAVFAEPTKARKWGAMISTTCEDLDAALAYMDAYFATYDNPLNEEGTIFNLSLWLGEEGVDWEWKVEGESYVEFAKPDGWAAKNGFSGTPYIGEFHAMRLNEEGEADLLPLGVKNNCLPYAKAVIRDDALAMTEEETEVYNEKWTDLSKYIAQMYTGFVRGEYDIDTMWDEYLQNLETMGLEELLDCYEAALVRYNARQN